MKKRKRRRKGEGGGRKKKKRGSEGFATSHGSSSWNCENFED